MLTALYASPQPSIRRYVWDQLEALERGLPWMIVGDFNCVLLDEERSSKIRASGLFQNWVRDNGMIDMGFFAPNTHGDMAIAQRPGGQRG